MSRDPDIRGGVREVVSEVTLAFLGEPSVPAAPASDAPSAQWWSRVRVAGAWDGVVEVSCAVDFARRAASAMFDGATDDDAARDAIAEITSMIGGNLRPVVVPVGDTTCTLSPPTVGAASTGHEGFVALCVESFGCGSDTLTVYVGEVAGVADSGGA